MKSFPTREAVDFVIVGSGAAGGVLARELSKAGFDVVVLEQGPWRQASDFTHDEWSIIFGNELTGGAMNDPQTFRESSSQKAVIPGGGPPPAMYARTVGGSSIHFSGNYWRMRPLDFNERSKLGPVSGTGFADWPIDYEELEPYYTKAEWEIGVSGEAGPFDPPRSKGYPVPPMPQKSAGYLLEKGARKLGLHPQPAPLAILSQPYRGRPACVHCGFCMGFGCEVNAKSSTLVTMIPEAVATGRCEVRPHSTVHRVDIGSDGRVRQVLYFDAEGQEQGQKAKAVILAANGAETPRLLLMSESSRHPQGLANSSGLVGKYLMFNSHSTAYGLFEHPLNEYKSVQCTHIVMDFYDNDEKRGFYGGGGLDARPLVNAYPILFGMNGLPPGSPSWGAEYKKMLAHYYTRNMGILCSGTSLALESNNITLDPDTRDGYGRPCVRMTYRDHDDDLALQRFLQTRAAEILEAAGAQRTWVDPVVPQNFAAHLLGTCRMGDDPERSVVDRNHRTHDIDNLFICDGSSLVTSGRGQPTLTIQALAFRAADKIAEAARSGAL